MCRIGLRSRASAHRYSRHSIRGGRSPDKTNPREPRLARAGSPACACRWSDRSRDTLSRIQPAERDRGTRRYVERNLAIPAGRIGGLWDQPIGALREIEFEGLALVLQAAAGPKIGVVVEIIERRIEDELCECSRCAMRHSNPPSSRPKTSRSPSLV